MHACLRPALHHLLSGAMVKTLLGNSMDPGWVLKGSRNMLRFDTRVTSVDGNTLVLERALPWAVDTAFSPEVHAIKPMLENAGVENLSFEFPWTKCVGVAVCEECLWVARPRSSRSIGADVQAWWFILHELMPPVAPTAIAATAGSVTCCGALFDACHLPLGFKTTSTCSTAWHTLPCHSCAYCALAQVQWTLEGEGLQRHPFQSDGKQLDQGRPHNQQ